MEDAKIVALYWERSEEAIRETDVKYGAYLNQISYQILHSREDAGECVNDTYHDAWNAMPPHQPSFLAAFLGKITRRISIDCWRHRQADKRGGGELPLALEELGECVSGRPSVEEEAIGREALETVQKFLDDLPPTERRVFLCRYWYLDSIAELAARFGFTEGKVKSMLRRTREKLRIVLEQEGY